MTGREAHKAVREPARADGGARRRTRSTYLIRAGSQRGFPALVLAVLASACAGHLPPEASPRQVAREECRSFLGRTGFAAGLRRGTRGWDQALEVCTAQHLGAAGEIDRAAAALEAQ